MKTKMMAAAMAYSVDRFNAEMEFIKAEDVKAFEWLVDKGTSHWARSGFRTTLKCDMLLNNMCECFNGTR